MTGILLLGAFILFCMACFAVLILVARKLTGEDQ
jgi:hypothetical protein